MHGHHESMRNISLDGLFQIQRNSILNNTKISSTTKNIKLDKSIDVSISDTNILMSSKSTLVSRIGMDLTQPMNLFKKLSQDG